MILRGLLILAAASLAACGATPVHIESRAVGQDVASAPERYIIAAVDNDPVSFMSHAGSTPRGYDTVTAYGPTPHAREVMHALEAEYGLREVNSWPIESLHMHCAVLEVPSGADRAELINRLSHDRRVRLTQPLQTFATRTAASGGGAYNDPYIGLQSGFQQMDVADAHPWSRGEGVRLALIDTGVDLEHPDLHGTIAAAANFVDDNDQQFRRDRHGTEMAGVIAAVANNREGIVGVAPAVRLYVFKACWQSRSDADAARCNSFTLARALAAAFDAHAQIINLSIAGPNDPLVSDLIREGMRRGVLFVGAAISDASTGKEGLLHQPGVIEVASSEARSSIDNALYAPGREILTLMPGGHYDFASGESIATAQVSGVVALMLAKNPSLTALRAYELLRDTSASAGDAQNTIRSVDACAAVVTLTHQGTCRPLSDIPGVKPAETRLAIH